MADTDMDAEDAHAEARALIDERRFRDAIAPAAEVCRLRPEFGPGWWNYAVALKHTHRWTDCLAACERAIELDPDEADGMHWNAGIAATALGDWKRARAAWTAYGIDIPDGDGPLEMRIGVTCVRVSLESEPEVVWCRRLDPCRARILSVPLPATARRYGDVVLHDGEPRGKRPHPNGEVSVFDELVLLELSPFGTWEVTASCAGEHERDALLALFEEVDGAIEDWTESIQTLCTKCSLGTPHEHHDRARGGWQTERSFGLALREARDADRLRGRVGVRAVTRVL